MSTLHTVKPREEIKRRSSFNMNNALRFKPILDQAIANWRDPAMHVKDVFISYDSTALAPSTLAQRMTESLRWLIDNYELVPANLAGPYTAEDYAILRGVIRFRREREGMRITFPGSFITPSYRTMTSDALVVKWKTDLETFMADPNRSMLRINGLMLAPIDIKWIETYLGGDVESEITHDHIMVVKPTA